jgi:hypothetical protein
MCEPTSGSPSKNQSSAGVLAIYGSRFASSCVTSGSVCSLELKVVFSPGLRRIFLQSGEKPGRSRRRRKIPEESRRRTRRACPSSEIGPRESPHLFSNRPSSRWGPSARRVGHSSVKCPPNQLPRLAPKLSRHGLRRDRDHRYRHRNTNEQAKAKKCGGLAFSKYSSHLKLLGIADSNLWVVDPS